MASIRRYSPNRRRSSVHIRRGSVYMASGAIKQINIEDEYKVLKQLGTGRYSVVKLAEHKSSKKVIALKMFARGVVRQADFLREYNYSFFLSHHQNVVDTYEGVFCTDDSFFFAQEFCPTASLREMILDSQHGIDEDTLKKILVSALAALEFLHSEKLVHRNFKAENILIFDPKVYQRVKITDFGLTRKEDTVVRHVDKNNAYHAPELCETLQKETYAVNNLVDVWAIGVVIFYALRKVFPWDRAHITSKPYFAWEQWMKRKNPQLPKRFAHRFTERGLKLFRKTLNPRMDDRIAMKKIKKYLKDRWMENIRSVSEEDLCPELDMRGRAGSEGPGPGMPRAVSTSGLLSGRGKSPVPDFTGKGYADHDNTSDFLAPPNAQTKRRSFLSNLVANTISTMSEISEQVVSASPDKK